MQLNTMQWSAVDDISEVAPISENDDACLSDIQTVLKKYGNLNRFGVTLIHKHFDLADDEIMLETTDEEKREHWVRPVKLSAIEKAGADVQTTVITFDESGYKQGCTCLMVGGGHTGRHGSF